MHFKVIAGDFEGHPSGIAAHIEPELDHTQRTPFEAFAVLDIMLKTAQRRDFRGDSLV